MADRLDNYFLDSSFFWKRSADIGDKLHKWIYGNGEVHFGPQVNDMDDPPYHSNLVFSHFGTPPDDIACGYYWPIDNSVHMYSRTDKSPARETLNAIVPQEALVQGLTDQPHEANIEGHEPGEQWGRWLRHPQTGEIVTDHSGLTHWGIVSQLGLSDKDFERPYALNPSAELEGGDIYYHNGKPIYLDWIGNPIPDPHITHQAGVYPTDWTHKWIWADGKMDHCDAQLGQPNYSHHESMLHEMGYNAYTGQPENYIGGLYNANTGDYSSHGYWGRVPSEEELKAELAQRTSPKNHEASDRYTGPPASVVHIPTGDMGEPLGRIPGIYDSNTNTFYHGDRGGSHYPLVDHLRQPETDDDYLDDTVDYWDYMGDHMIPTIYFPVDSDYNGRLDWAQRIKPELQRQFMDAMERHVSNPTHEAYMLGRVKSAVQKNYSKPLGS